MWHFQGHLDDGWKCVLKESTLLGRICRQRVRCGMCECVWGERGGGGSALVDQVSMCVVWSMCVCACVCVVEEYVLFVWICFERVTCGVCKCVCE